jgi:hypothetical protein
MLPGRGLRKAQDEEEMRKMPDSTASLWPAEVDVKLDTAFS